MIDTPLFEHQHTYRALGEDLLLGAAFFPLLPLLFVWLTTERQIGPLMSPALIAGTLLYWAGLWVVGVWNRRHMARFLYQITRTQVQCRHPKHRALNYQLPMSDLMALECPAQQDLATKAQYQLVTHSGQVYPIPNDYHNPLSQIKTALTLAKPDLIVRHSISHSVRQP